MVLVMLCSVFNFICTLYIKRLECGSDQDRELVMTCGRWLFVMPKLETCSQKVKGFDCSLTVKIKYINVISNHISNSMTYG